MSYFEDLKAQEGVLIRSLARYVYATTSRVNQNARYGDKMVVDQFSAMIGISNDRLNLLAVADNLGTMMLSNQIEYNRGGGTLVCGSPNEVAPDPLLDDYFDGLEADQECFGCQSSYINYYQQKQTVWTMNVLEAEDQLCQRMAWALYEHLNVGITTAPDNTETNLYSYDIMTRHCFGSYFDLLKEMVYNPKIGEQFNSVGSASARQKWDVHRQLVLPDENLGREIMQVRGHPLFHSCIMLCFMTLLNRLLFTTCSQKLFTIGLHELNHDGTEVRDQFGRIVQTYDNHDIMTNARVLTGFVYTARRGNVEELFRSNKSRMDPMRVDIDAHDYFPKASVDGNWIGDRYPLCVDLPKHHFLKIGATFRFRGGSTLPQSHYAPGEILFVYNHYHPAITPLFSHIFTSLRDFQYTGTQTNQLGGSFFLPSQTCIKNSAVLMRMASVSSLTPYPLTQTLNVLDENAEWTLSSLSKLPLAPSMNTSDSLACTYHFTMMRRRL